MYLFFMALEMNPLRIQIKYTYINFVFIFKSSDLSNLYTYIYTNTYKTNKIIFLFLNFQT